MFRCQRCDTTFPRVLGRVHYLLVPETEYTRVKKELEENKMNLKKLDQQIEALRQEKAEREQLLSKQVRDGEISSLEAEIRQLEKNVKQLKSEKERMKAELEE